MYFTQESVNLLKNNNNNKHMFSRFINSFCSIKRFLFVLPLAPGTCPGAPGNSQPGHVAEAGQTLPRTPTPRQCLVAICRSTGDPVLPLTWAGGPATHLHQTLPGFRSEAASGEVTGPALPLSRCNKEPCYIFIETHH